MENKIVFREMLTEIKNAADAAGNRITKEKIRTMLAGMPLTEEHFGMIYEYLASQNIRVTDTEDEAEELPEESDQRSLELYLEELEQIGQTAFSDEKELFERVKKGDQRAREKLIESYLTLICDMAGEYEDRELAAEDLIQEGNLGLLMAMETMEKYDSPAACRVHILNSVSEAMEQAIRINKEEREGGEAIAGRVNHLNEAVHNLEEELSHRVSPEELSAYLEIPLEEIRDILRMSGDQIEVEKPEDPQGN